MAEELGEDEGLGQARAVRGDEGPAAVDRAGDQLLARPAFAGDEHRVRRPGDALQRAVQLLHGLGGADQLAVAVAAPGERFVEVRGVAVEPREVAEDPLLVAVVEVDRAVVRPEGHDADGADLLFLEAANPGEVGVRRDERASFRAGAVEQRAADFLARVADLVAVHVARDRDAVAQDEEAALGSRDPEEGVEDARGIGLCGGVEEAEDVLVLHRHSRTRASPAAASSSARSRVGASL